MTWSHEQNGYAGPAWVTLASGASVPAASGYAEGTILTPHPDDAGGGQSWFCVDVSGTKHWLGPKNTLQMVNDEDRIITATTRYFPQWAPTASRRAILWSIDGHWSQIQGTTGTNYYDLTVEFMGATLASFSTKNGADDVWKRISQSVLAVVNYAALDDDADAGLTRALSCLFTEGGAQQMGWAAGLTVREILE